MRRYQIAFLLFGMSLLSYVDCATLSFAAKGIADTFQLTPVALGVLFSSFLWAYSALVGPMGLLVDRFGPKRVAGLGVAVWSAATAAGGGDRPVQRRILCRAGALRGLTPSSPTSSPPKSASTSYDAHTGELDLRAVHRTVPADADPGATTAEVLATAEDTVLVTNRGHDSLYCARFAERETLDTPSWTPCGGRGPRFATFGPSPHQLLVANELSDTVCGFDLSPAGRPTLAPAPAIPTSSPV